MLYIAMFDAVYQGGKAGYRKEQQVRIIEAEDEEVAGAKLQTSLNFETEDKVTTVNLKMWPVIT